MDAADAPSTPTRNFELGMALRNQRGALIAASCGNINGIDGKGHRECRCFWNNYQLLAIRLTLA